MASPRAVEDRAHLPFSVSWNSPTFHRVRLGLGSKFMPSAQGESQQRGLKTGTKGSASSRKAEVAKRGCCCIQRGPHPSPCISWSDRPLQPSAHDSARPGLCSWDPSLCWPGQQCKGSPASFPLLGQEKQKGTSPAFFTSTETPPEFQMFSTHKHALLNVAFNLTFYYQVVSKLLRKG